MSRTGWLLFVLSLPSGLDVVALVIQYRSFFPQRVSRIHFVGLIVLTLALFSNLVLWAARTAWQLTPPRTSWKVLLISFLLLNTSLVFFLPVFAHVFGYWLWLMAFAILTWALLFLPPEPAAAAPPKSSRTLPWRRYAPDVSDAVPEVVWVALAVTIFWLAVTVVNYSDGRSRSKPALASASRGPVALNSYFTDSANLFQAGEQQRFATSLAAFEHTTSNQIAVAIYPRLPEEPIEDFTIRIAEASHLGSGKLDNGVILFIFMSERVARIEVGYGLESALPDAVCRRILATEFAPRFSSGEYREGIESTLAAIETTVEAEFGNGRTETLPAFLARLYPQLKVAVIKVARNAWPLARDAPLEARMGLSFFGILLGFGVWSGVVNFARLLWSMAMGVWNLIRHRPFKHGMVTVAFEPMWDTLKLAVILASIAGIYVAVAGGGSFGGAGAVIHWANSAVKSSRHSQFRSRISIVDSRKHWESVYGSKSVTDVSWYQREATLSLQLIRRVAPDLRSSILDVGGGASTLVDSLVSAGYTDVTVLDIAANALAKAQARLGENDVRWIAGDVLALDLPDHSIDVWHDRAVFHFLVESADRRRYVEQVRRVMRPNGHVIVATFAEDGPTKCSGLPVARYDATTLHGEFGRDFHLLETIREEHGTPSGGRQMFRYCLCSFQPDAAVAAA
jgi:uncharacterized membrane protein YgcG/SAM-dependent methyltransferase